MSTLATNRVIDKEAFERTIDAFKRFEVENGQLVEVEPMGNLQSTVVVNLSYFLLQHLGGPPCYQLFESEARFRLKKNPDLIRGADLSYVPAERIPAGGPDSKVGDYIPALVVEVISDSNPGERIVSKTDEWFEAGASLLWIVYPMAKVVYVYSDPNSCRILRKGDNLDGGTVLPGLQIPLDRIFK